MHIEQHQAREVRAKARYWLPPRQRMDQAAPYNQPGSLPTAELLLGWFEAHLAHRICPRPHTVLRIAPASRPHRLAICRRLLTSPQSATATSCRGLGSLSLRDCHPAATRVTVPEGLPSGPPPPQAPSGAAARSGTTGWRPSAAAARAGRSLAVSFAVAGGAFGETGRQRRAAGS